MKLGALVEISARRESGSRGRLALAGLCLSFGLLCLVGTSANYTYADDSRPFANVVLHGARANVHHLMLWILHRFASGIGIQDLSAAIHLFKLYVALAGAAGLGLVGALALEWYGSRRAALAAMLACAFSYGFWSYSITTDFYVPAGTFALLAIWLASRSESGRRPFLWLALAAVSTVCSSVNHQAYGLVAAPIFVGLLIGGRGQRSLAEGLRRSFAFGVSVALLEFATFFAAFRSSGEADFVRFLRGYEAWMAMLPYDHLQKGTLLYALVGISRAAFFTDYILRFDSAYEFVQSKFALKLILDDRYLIGDMSQLHVAVLLALAVLCCGLFLFLAGAAIRWGFEGRPGRPGFAMLVGWMVLQSSFFALWEPSSNEFWIWLLPCLSLVVVAPAASRLRQGPLAPLPWLLVAGLALVNAPVVRRYGRADRCIYRINKTYLERLGPDDLVISGDGYPINWFHTLYRHAAPEVEFYRNAFTLRDTTLQARVAALRPARSRIFLDPGVVMPNQAELALQSETVRAGTIHVDVEESERELLRFEEQCRASGIPLYGVERKGADVVPLRRRTFAGWLRYVEADSIGALRP